MTRTIGGMGRVSQIPGERQCRSRHVAAVLVALAASLTATCAPANPSKARPSVFDTTLEEQGQRTPELSTDDLKAMLANGSAILFDARPPEEYASAHIPGSLNLDEKQLGRFTQSFPDRATGIVLYSNGPFCDLARLRSEDLLRLGYSKINRSQLGLPVWRALGNISETSLQGFRQVVRDSNSVLVDARGRELPVGVGHQIGVGER